MSGSEGGPPDGAGEERLGLWRLLAEDLQTHAGDIREAGFWALAVHRIGSRARDLDLPGLRRPIRALAGALTTSADWFLGIELPLQMKLGRRIRLWHHGCMRIAAREIGNDVHIRHNTTFGPARGDPDDARHWPVIGDRVELGAGACVLGGVRVGHDAIIGANSLVIEDVAPSSTVTGVPARRLLARR